MPRPYNSGRLLFSLLLLTALAACASAPPINRPKAELYDARCAALLTRLEFHIHKAKVRDAQHAVLEGYSLLRIDRMLQALKADVQSREQRKQWLATASAYAIQGYVVETANLPPERRKTLPAPEELRAELSDCAWQQVTTLSSDKHWKRLRRKAKVPSEYFAGRKALGLYPITNLAMKAGINEWQKDTRQLFNTAIGNLENYQHWIPAADTKVVGSISYNALNLPEPSEQQWATLAQNHAPEWMLELQGFYDLPGRPLSGGEFSQAPVVYWQPSVIRVHGEWLPQISYVMWFAERPKTSALDILGGKLDGLLWRVTLKEQRGDWVPLIYDSIHPCGCYHLFFPTKELAHCAVDSSRESAFVPQAAPKNDFAVWVQSGTHYLKRLAAAPDDVFTQRYQLERLDQLRYAGSSGQRLFSSNGIAKGTERLERWLLWTSGLESPGAMRQWGNHATAFSGERYFDEPDLFDGEFCAK